MVMAERIKATPAPAPIPALAATESPSLESSSVLTAASEVDELEDAAEVLEVIGLILVVNPDADCDHVSHESCERSESSWYLLCQT